METKPIFSFQEEIVRCEYKPEAGAMFAYNSIPIHQGSETYRAKLNEMLVRFKECAFQLSLENGASLAFVLSQFQKTQVEAAYDIPDEGYLSAMVKDAFNNRNPALQQSIEEVRFLNEMVGLQKWFLQQAIDFLQELSGKQVKRPTRQETQQELPASIEQSPLQKTLDEYGELLSVNDLTEIFHCDRRTITNWEAAGYLHNVAETSQETNTLGRRKRGQEKRYRKDAVLKQLKLQEKYNAIAGR